MNNIDRLSFINIFNFSLYTTLNKFIYLFKPSFFLSLKGLQQLKSLEGEEIKGEKKRLY